MANKLDVKAYVMDKTKRIAEAALNEARSTLTQDAADAVTSVDSMIDIMMSRDFGIDAAASVNQYSHLNDADIVTAIDDDRKVAGVIPALIGCLFFIMAIKSAGILAWVCSIIGLAGFGFGAFLFYVFYIRNARVQVPETADLVVARDGCPLSKSEYPTTAGRNWFFAQDTFPVAKVSNQDQVIQMTMFGFMRDYGTVKMDTQIGFKITDPAKFVATTTPSCFGETLCLQAGHIFLRLITSVSDARVKFIGRQNLTNVVQILNATIRDAYGAEVVYVNVSFVDNAITNELEGVRTLVQTIRSLQTKKRTQMERAIAAVEAEIRDAIREAVTASLNLNNQLLSLDGAIRQTVSDYRQTLIIGARRKIETETSQLLQALNGFRDQKALDEASILALPVFEIDMKLRMALAQKTAREKMLPKRVMLFDVENIGPGIGLSIGRQLFDAMQSPISPAAKEVPQVNDPAFVTAAANFADDVLEKAQGKRK